MKRVFCSRVGDLLATNCAQVPPSPGIYRFASQFGDYVGQSLNIQKRVKQHVVLFATNSHPNNRLGLIFSEVGEDVQFEVLEIAPRSVQHDLKKWLSSKEAYWIQRTGGALNIAPANAKSFDAKKNAFLTLEHETSLRALMGELERKEPQLGQYLQEWADEEARLKKELAELRSRLLLESAKRPLIMRLLDRSSRAMDEIKERIGWVKAEIAIMADDGVELHNSPHEIERELACIRSRIETTQRILSFLHKERAFFEGDER